ncbi:MAG: hypothetical protein KKC79_17815 [Gammaproteobacteria bacterium]|nr:hypothetical protein [Gammaproteobacteria bacterium]MBU1441765.1 hypothetical protein [Gammaproteobacteria bacterium]MBU2410493.1 hypothetical protein [Gammaproteobacteria bacterium]
MPMRAAAKVEFLAAVEQLEKTLPIAQSDPVDLGAVLMAIEKVEDAIRKLAETYRASVDHKNGEPLDPS